MGNRGGARPAPNGRAVSPLLATVLWLAACGPSRQEEIRLGRELYRGRGCAACHGAQGRGDGPLAGRLAPRDLTRPVTYLQGATAAEIERTLALGVPGGKMPVYSFLPPEERHRLALYVHSLSSPPTAALP